MAKAEIKMPEDFLLKLSKLGDQTDVIIPKVLEAGGEVVLTKVRGNLHSVIGKDVKSKKPSTGELASSLGVTTAKQDRNGNHNVKVGFAEPRRGKGGSNAKLASIIEHGKHGQPAKPFLKPAKSSSKQACVDAMKARFDEEIEKI